MSLFFGVPELPLGAQQTNKKTPKAYFLVCPTRLELAQL